MLELHLIYSQSMQCSFRYSLKYNNINVQLLTILRSAIKEHKVASEFKLEYLIYSGKPRKYYKRKITLKQRPEGSIDFSYIHLCMCLCLYVCGSLGMFGGCESGDMIRDYSIMHPPKKEICCSQNI